MGFAKDPNGALSGVKHCTLRLGTRGEGLIRRKGEAIVGFRCSDFIRLIRGKPHTWVGPVVVYT